MYLLSIEQNVFIYYNSLIKKQYDMKTKVFLTLVLAFFIIQFTFAQESDTPNHTRMVGISTAFVNNFLPFENPIGSLGQHPFHFIKHKKDNKYRKQAFDFFVNGNTSSRTDAFFENTIRAGIEYKTGIVKRKEIFKNRKGYLLYGPEFLIDYSFARNFTERESSGSTISSARGIINTLGLGIGPVLGLGYNITKRLSLYTEAGFYLRAKGTHDSVKNTFQTQEPRTENFLATSFSTAFIYPHSLILFYHF